MGRDLCVIPEVRLHMKCLQENGCIAHREIYHRVESTAVTGLYSFHDAEVCVFIKPSDLLQLSLALSLCFFPIVLWECKLMHDIAH